MNRLALSFGYYFPKAPDGAFVKSIAILCTDSLTVALGLSGRVANKFATLPF